MMKEFKIDDTFFKNEIDYKDLDDCYFSDMPTERIKPLIDILKEDK